ncbi:E1 protein [Sus scrofa papillomavirus 2]|uniref:Replication protein E1 n=1 Tax=Sus scrofa papillomavirus 2 TaxID=2025338 RepID=A0A223FQU8_9PAPI|nr:E1 protein [Sus scrofa papillomavirus 2]AST11576.1 E1 protein [Sus scrofa papillomavirus 2]
MADYAEGTSNTDCVDSFICHEALCSDEDNSDKENEAGSVVSDLIDDSEVCQGNSLELFQQKQMHDDRVQLQRVLKQKRKLSRPLSDISVSGRSNEDSPRKKRTSRRFGNSLEDSGLGCSFQNEASCTHEGTQVDSCGASGGSTAVPSGVVRCLDLLKSSNAQATMLAKFKEAVGVSYMELTRKFKSNKTCCGDWVLAIFGVTETVFEILKSVFQQHCSYMHISMLPAKSCLLVVFLASFKAGKSRETVLRLVKSTVGAETVHMLAEPPKTRSMAAALYWFKTGHSPSTFIYGKLPEWISRQTMISHQTADQVTFDLSEMVQWAYDNDYRDEAKIAYEYAKLGELDSNALAWLRTSNQAKYVRDVATMVRYYKKAEMNEMSTARWIYYRMKKCDREEGSWKPIVLFLRYQEIEFVSFLQFFKDFLKGVPKKNCLCIHGPANTGKSMFTMSLINFFGGRVLSFANSRSHFWLQPLAETKLALIDDATKPCWDYLDTFLRNGLDGNPVCIDLKHKAPIQLKCPPLMITSNIAIKEEDRWPYLNSRVQCFHFKNEFPFNPDGTPAYQFNDSNWKSFFGRLWQQLDLSDQEDEGEDGEDLPPFKCGARRATESV